MKSSKLLMIGAGRMAEAIISGLISKDESLFSSITVVNRSDKKRLEELSSKYGVETTSDWKGVIKNSKVIVLAAPPNAHQGLFDELSDNLDGQLVITVAAGIDPTMMESRLPEGTPVCWMMPNTAALVQKSMTTFTCGKMVTESNRAIIEHILGSIGDYEELTEEQVHNLTAVTGSAPAFLYLFTEALEEAAIKYGLSKEQAQRLVIKMIAGSASMLETGTPASTLRDQVTTPGGSTAAGVKVLEDSKFKEIVNQAILATNEHARGN